MHEPIEIIMPPTNDIEGQVAKIMKPFDENNEDSFRQGWWDFYVIGGRFSGIKETEGFDENRITRFKEALEERKVTVSGLQAGKPELAPADQIPMVDKLWKEHFPEFRGDHCPLFRHSNNQYENRPLWPDVMILEEVPEDIKRAKVLIATQQYNGEVEAESIFQDAIWNGCNFEKTAWDGTIRGALDLHNEWSQRLSEEAQGRIIPKPDWLVVTVDIHH